LKSSDEAVTPRDPAGEDRSGCVIQRYRGNIVEYSALHYLERYPVREAGAGRLIKPDRWPTTHLVSLA